MSYVTYIVVRVDKYAALADGYAEYGPTFVAASSLPRTLLPTVRLLPQYRCENAPSGDKYSDEYHPTIDGLTAPTTRQIVAHLQKIRREKSERSINERVEHVEKAYVEAVQRTEKAYEEAVRCAESVEKAYEDAVQCNDKVAKEVEAARLDKCANSASLAELEYAENNALALAV